MLRSLQTFGFTLSAFARPYYSRAHMEAYQLRKLKTLLRYAAAHVPYYSNLFSSHGIEADDIHSLSDFRRIPLTGKQQLRELFRSIPDGEIDRKELIEHKTSGSTGIPIHILRSPTEERRLNMLHWRMHWMLGLRPGDRIGKVKTTWEPLSPRFNRLQHLARSTGLVTDCMFDCLLDPAENYPKIVAFQPHILTGYPGALVKIALQHAKQGGELMSLRRVSCGGESLAPHQRRILESSFGVPVLDLYAASECHLAAWVCPQTGLYHVCDDGIILEICRDGIPVTTGQSGEIVITSLHSRTMPIIRHAMGDRAVAGPSPCPCGQPFSTIEKLQGRTIDFLPVADGRELHPFELLNEIVIESGDWLVEYQVIQEERGRVRLLIVPQRPVSTGEEARFRQALVEKLGPGTQLKIEWTDSIALEESGKLHFCRSNNS